MIARSKKALLLPSVWPGIEYMININPICLENKSILFTQFYLM